MDFDLRFWGPYPPLLQWAAYWITDICRTRVLTNYVLLNILTNSQMSALSLFRSISTYYRFMFHGMFQQNALRFATILEYYTFSCFEFLPNQILLPFSKNHQLFRKVLLSWTWKLTNHNCCTYRSWSYSTTEELSALIFHMIRKIDKCYRVERLKFCYR